MGRQYRSLEEISESQGACGCGYEVERRDVPEAAALKGDQSSKSPARVPAPDDPRATAGWMRPGQMRVKCPKTPAWRRSTLQLSAI